MNVPPLALVAAGLGTLVIGARILVRGASSLAAAAGISPLVIGLTVVAFGTSAPEMAVSVNGALAGGAGVDVAVGNVVGSNICNVLLILGLSALMAPLAVSRQLVRWDVPLMIAASALMLVMAFDGSVSRTEGAVLIGLVIAYTGWSIVLGRREHRSAAELAAAAGLPPGAGVRRGAGAVSLYVVFVLAGLALLVLGSDWLLEGAIELARSLGVSELVIGLTVVALGTSLPEVATTVAAGLKGERDIAIGNVVGSNLFNVLAVLGCAAAVAPSGVSVAPAALRFDIPVMLAAAVACIPIFFTGGRVSRLEGLLLLAYYGAYVAYLVLAASHHRALPLLSWVMFLFVVPLTVLGLAAAAAKELRARKVRG